MKIGILSDIHGNLPALEAVLDDLSTVDEIVCAGDVVGYNPWPGECVERVRDVADVCVQGNHDRKVEHPTEYSHNEMARAGLEHAQRELSDEQVRWLSDLPRRTTIVDGYVRLVHSHPDPEKLGRYVRPRDFPRMRPYLDNFDALVLGHTHVQHRAYVDGRTIVNPGSVGQPRDGNPRAAYAILDTGEISFDLRPVEYDINRVIDKVEDSDSPVETGTRLLDGS